jgi:putative glutamine amidotransferase
MKLMRVLVPFRNQNKVEPYLAALRAAEIEPVAFLTDKPTSLDGVVGILFTGGTDINPQRYGQELQPETEEPDDERDLVELDLLGKAIQNDLPVLAICRGVQLLNVYHGGTLIQHLGSARHRPELEDRSKPAHEVIVEPTTILADAVSSSRLAVNSRHHQAVGAVGAGLRVSARDTDDGIIEGLERTDKRFVVGVQWHPEDQVFTQPAQLRLFQAFGKALV